MPRLCSYDATAPHWPHTQAPKYRESCILMADTLAVIDDEAVPPLQRQNLMRLHVSPLAPL